MSEVFVSVNGFQFKMLRGKIQTKQSSVSSRVLLDLITNVTALLKPNIKLLKWPN